MQLFKQEVHHILLENGINENIPELDSKNLTFILKLVF